MNTFWDEMEHLSDDAVFLYIWSWTNPKCGMAGIYRIAERKLLEGRLDTDRVKAALAELEADGKLRYVGGVLWNVARVKRLSGISANYAKSIARDVKEIAGNPLFDEFLERYGDFNEKLTKELKGSEGSKGSNPSGSLDQGLQDGSPEPDAGTLTEGLSKGSRRDHGQGQGHGSSFRPGEEPELPSVYRYVVAALERVAFARGLSSPVVSAVAQACADFPDHDLERDADEFAHYWIDGPGAGKPLSDVAWSWRKWLGRNKARPAASNARASVSDDLKRLEVEAARLRAEEART